MSPDLFVWHYTEIAAARTEHYMYIDVFVRDNASRGLYYDNWKFNAGAILFGENQCKKNGISRFKLCFRFAFGWNQVKYASIMIKHACFIASGDVWTLSLMVSCSNSFLGTWQMLIFTFPLRVLKWTPTFEMLVIASWTDLFKPHQHTRCLGGPTSMPSINAVLFTDVCLTSSAYRHDVQRGTLAFWLFPTLSYV